MKLIDEKEHCDVLKGTIYLAVKIQLIEEASGNDIIRAEASMDNGQGMRLIGGADIYLFPVSPVLSILPHTTELIKNGLMLSVASALIGAIGPKIGKCLGDESISGRLIVQNRIKEQLKDLLPPAFEAVKACIE